jgi:hypothetical protein
MMFNIDGSRRNAAWLWSLLLVALSLVGSLAFACVTPFAAFAVAAAWALSLRAALLTVACVWLGNQVIGFSFLDYPWTPDTALWGLAIGAATLAATAIAGTIMRTTGPHRALALGSGFAAAFAVYEIALFLVTFGLGGQEAFAPAIVGQFALLNLAWTIPLVAVWEILRRARTIGPRTAGAVSSLAP